MYIATYNTAIVLTPSDSLGKIAWVRYQFLTQDKISDILIRCARIRDLSIRTETFVPTITVWQHEACRVMNDRFRAWVMMN